MTHVISTTESYQRAQNWLKKNNLKIRNFMCVGGMGTLYLSLKE